FGNIYAFNYEAIEILKINDDLKIEKNWFINFNITSLPSLTIGSNNKIYVYLPLIGIVEYSSEGKILKQVLNDPACIDKYETISIGARGKITANNGNNIFLWFTKQGKSKAFSFNMDTEQCKRENIGEYINFMAFDKKSRVVVMAPSWIFVTGFFELKGNSAIYPKSLSPEAIVIDNLNNYYIYNLDMNEILVIKDTGKINRIIKLDSSIVIK
ncbi:hypothetical protein HY745_06735, partial [Candidatus Desantisbacteria bacterium]|nr:hypothetical protein [Candidatus Desantisbacteria bacterium]